MKKYNIINNALGWACFLVAAVTYMLTLEPTASFWDCPEFIAQGAKLEVGHPPGNPIFMLAARFFVTLFGCDMANAALAVNSMSALLSAATILLLFWTITHLVRRLIVRDDAESISPWKMALIFGGGICGALAYTWSDTFWFSAVEGEVYAFSSFCTALVFWLILKWEDRADHPHSDRYLILIAYIIGVSIAVHLLNLLCIPAIVLVFYYKKFKNVNTKGSLLALCVSFVIVALILFGLVPGFVKVAQWFELLFVNTFGMSYNMGVLFYAIVLVGVFVWAISAHYRQKSVAAIKWSFFLSIVLSGMLFIGNWMIAAVLLCGLAVYLWGFCKQVPVRIFNVVVLSVFLIFVGYSSYALLLIRSTANTPMNQNAPDNVFDLSSYLNREQYGQTPLFYGAVFAEELVEEDFGEDGKWVQIDENGRPKTRLVGQLLRDHYGDAVYEKGYTYEKKAKTDPSQPDEYIKVESESNSDFSEISELKMLFPRIYSGSDRNVPGYKSWSGYTTPDLYDIPAEQLKIWANSGYGYIPKAELMPYLHSQEEVVTRVNPNGTPAETRMVWKPGFAANLQYFFNYQFSHMYWRYFMWNFAGRQNDIQGNSEPHLGNWISGIPFIDNARLGDQSLLPDEYGKGNKGRNVYFLLPLLLGIIGLLWQALYIKRDAPQRGIEQFWVVCFLFFMTGLAIVLYLNQTPGQPRERDYAFAGSFYAFAIWIGIGVPAIGMMLRSLFAKLNKTETDKVEKQPAGIAAAALAVAIGLAVPVQMVSQTWDDHDRSGRYAARDFGMNYLSSVDENAILFCNGDNDTFPLWYAQEVEGYRTDVRVINLSYLTGEWYVDQQRVQSYDGMPVDFFAAPNDYAHGKLTWSYVVPENKDLVEAEQSLRATFASYNAPNKYGIKETAIMTSPNLYLPVDTAVAEKQFGGKPLPELRVNYSGSKSALNLSELMTLDIIANSAKRGFTRPVYFATTVPSSYYIGFDRYMYVTGMTTEVTPFTGAVSPVAEKAYENIIGKFRWGGLDVEGSENIYLDETVRRMVGSTRSAMMQVASNLIAEGDAPATEWAKEHARSAGQTVPATRADMGRVILQTMLEKLPSKSAPIDGIYVIYIAEDFLKLYEMYGNEADLATAENLLRDNLPRFAQFVKYAGGLSYADRARLKYDLSNVNILSQMITLLNRIEVIRALDKDNEALAAWREQGYVAADDAFGEFIYVGGYSEADFIQMLGEYSDGMDYLNYIQTIYNVHNAAGVDPMALANKIMADYGISQETWLSLL